MRVLLLDADGVVLEKGEYFSEKFAREYNVPIAAVVDFFKGPFVACQKGEADLKEEIQLYLNKWKWPGSTDDFLDYWFKSDVVLNSEIKDIVSRFRDAGVKVYLATNNEIYRGTVIEALLRENNLVDGVYLSARMKVRKEDPEFFRGIISDLGIESRDVTFVDNDQKNIDSALSVGIDARLYRQDILNELIEAIISNKI